jgi:hypothetical protein
MARKKKTIKKVGVSSPSDEQREEAKKEQPEIIEVKKGLFILCFD